MAHVGTPINFPCSFTLDVIPGIVFFIHVNTRVDACSRLFPKEEAHMARENSMQN